MFEKFKLKRKIAKLEKQISQQNDDQARYDLAMIYLDGTVIKKDTVKADALLREAAANGHLKSKAALLSGKATDILNTGIDAVNNISEILGR